MNSAYAQMSDMGRVVPHAWVERCNAIFIFQIFAHFTLEYGEVM